MGIATQTHWLLPSDDEWYKAAFYNGTTSSYYAYPFQSNARPAEVAPPGGLNSGDFDSAASNSDGFGSQLTDVGSYPGSVSPFGSYDMGGDVWQWTETVDPLGDRRARGSSWESTAANSESTMAGDIAAFTTLGWYGFRVCQRPRAGQRYVGVLCPWGAADRQAAAAAESSETDEPPRSLISCRRRGSRFLLRQEAHNHRSREGDCKDHVGDHEQEVLDRLFVGMIDRPYSVRARPRSQRGEHKHDGKNYPLDTAQPARLLGLRLDLRRSVRVVVHAHHHSRPTSLPLGQAHLADELRNCAQKARHRHDAGQSVLSRHRQRGLF